MEECSKLEDADGEVFVWIDTPLSPDDPKVNVLSELARSCKKGSQLDSFTNEINRFTIENLTEEEVKSILQDFSYVTVVASLDNNRIKRQSGAFILFGMVYNNFESDLYSNKNVPFHIKQKNIELTINARNVLLEKLKFQIAEENDEDIALPYFKQAPESQQMNGKRAEQPVPKGCQNNDWQPFSAAGN